MLKLAFLIGAYSYTVFLLGILGLLYKQIVILFALFYFMLGVYFFIKREKKEFKLNNVDNFSKVLFFIILAAILVNFVGALGPELSFDALWYHLTLPKIFLENHKIFHIPGGLLYYSDMPKNIEMIYVFALSVGNEITAKFIHFLFGIASLFALYKLSRRFFSQSLSLLSVIVFYSSLVVGWQSITAYVDLGTAFFTILSVTEFLNWVDKKDNKHLTYTAILTGLSISTKVTSFVLVPIFILLIFWVSKNLKKDIASNFKDILGFVFVSALISLPWFLFSYLNTGNPFYPLFSKGFSFAYSFSQINFLRQIIFPLDPVSPIYLIFLPFIFIFYKKFNQNLKYLFLFTVLSILVWIFIAPIGGSRLILPYLPVFSVLIIGCLSFFKSKTANKYLTFLIIIIALSSVSYRFLANTKYIPIILGTETKENFLSENLNFSYGDFYDVDNFFRNQIKPNDKVLTFGFHNLYYADFPFIDSSFVKKRDRFNYIATQNTSLPERFSKFKQIHYNTKTGVRLYSDEGKMWDY